MISLISFTRRANSRAAVYVAKGNVLHKDDPPVGRFCQEDEDELDVVASSEEDEEWPSTWDGCLVVVDDDMERFVVVVVVIAAAAAKGRVLVRVISGAVVTTGKARAATVVDVLLLTTMALFRKDFLQAVILVLPVPRHMNNEARL
jgi:hypothetical protein